MPDRSSKSASAFTRLSVEEREMIADMTGELIAIQVYRGNGGAKLGHGSGGIVSLRAE